MTARLMILNGPNPNLLGVRERTYFDNACRYQDKREEFATFAGSHLSFHQSDQGAPGRGCPNSAYLWRRDAIAISR